ncbi:hypothetical protein evm_006311 [Chilo suppressalis]|nr:hypothetical protein evm_006311 [Chilo suppressalis]
MKETPTEEKTVEVKAAPRSKKRVGRFVVIILLAVTLAFFHYYYSWTLFENDRNFSYLSELEREMSLRTEMGFYYSYYKTLSQDYPFTVGVSRIMYDNLVEHPKEVNAFSRFNIHPEVIIGALYRYFEPWLNTTAHVECHIVSRPGYEPVESCVGLGVPSLFYLQPVWALAGVAAAAVFLHATLISESIIGGLLAVSQLFANHSEATRVHWAPNERENFAWPLLLMQAVLVSIQLRDKGRQTTLQIQLGVFFLNWLSLLFWQFTQFIFFTQTFIFFIMEQLYIIDNKSLCVFLHAHFCGLHTAVLLLQGNDMLKTSLYTSFFISVSVYSLLLSNLRVKVENRVDLFVEAWLVFLRVFIALFASLYVKKIISDFMGAEEDSHIWDLLFSKFNSDYSNFHTMLYTCSEVYDFLPLKTVFKLCKTNLIPMVLFSVSLVVNYWIQNAYQREKEIVEEVKKEMQDDEDSGIENNADTKLRNRKGLKNIKDLDAIDSEVIVNREETKDEFVEFVKRLKVEPDVFYCVAQLVVYGVMAALVMRLKLLFVTQLCIVSALMVNTKYFNVLPKAKKRLVKMLPALWAVLAAPLLYALFNNISHELSYEGEFSDPQLEELILWVRNNTVSGAAFAGSMPVMAAVMLSARRPIVNHPHYEHLEARQRAYAVYKAYGRFTSQELYQELSQLRASYLVMERHYCYGRSSLNCTYESIWDKERPDLSDRPSLCRVLDTTRVDHFYPVFKNHRYTVFRVHDMSVQYMPRSFDT